MAWKDAAWKTLVFLIAVTMGILLSTLFLGV